MEESTGDEREWLRVTGLLVVTVALAVVHPGVLIALPFVFLAMALPVPRLSLFVASAFAAYFVIGGGPSGGLWYLERGWAVLIGGWFVGLTLRWPRSRFFPRALGAVVGSFTVAALLFQVQPRSWSVVEWIVTDRMRAGAATALTAFRTLGGEGAVSAEMTDAVYRTVETQGLVFPALLGLASMSALGVAWWAWGRLGRSETGLLHPLPEFRFNDQLVWVFVAGLTVVLVGSSGGWERIGTNAVVFMGALYTLRGAAVLFFLNGGISLAGSVLLGLALVFLAPVIAAAALVVGLSDTWMDLRRRARAASDADT